MSYKSDLQSNNTDLQSILDTINSLPEAGSGGGSVETCTVTITSNDGSASVLEAISYTTYSSDDTTYYTEIAQSLPITLTDVKCGTAINIMFFNGGGVFGVRTTGSAHIVGEAMYIAGGYSLVTSVCDDSSGGTIDVYMASSPFLR